MSRFHRFLQYIAQAKFSNKEVLQTLMASMFINQQDFLSDKGESYHEIGAALATNISARANAGENDPTINVTNNFTETDIPSNSIAYHRIFGPIIADDDYWRWYFSTKKFVRDVKAAEANPKFIAHFLHVSTGGGEAWMLEKAFEAVANATKPVIVFIEKVCCSAGLYIAVPADRIFCYTVNDTIGSLGTMVAFMDFEPYYEAMGINMVEENANRSDLKNKKFKDLTDGKPEQYIKEELDPLQAQFEAAVRAARPQLTELPEDHPLWRGETFDATHSLKIGLIDEIAEIETAVLFAHQQGMENLEKEKANQQQALTYLNN